MRIEIEHLGSVRRDFYALRDELLAVGRKFDTTTLAVVSYSQLHLCCIGNAGEAACTSKLVADEKTRRRGRFLSMEPEELQAAETYLKVERMHSDVLFALAQRTAPRWDELKYRQRVWLKLACLFNHVDNPQQRLGHAVLLLRKSSTSDLPTEVAITFMNKLKGLLTCYPGKISDSVFREKISDIAGSLIEFLPVEERKVLEAEQLQDFVCTSDCFRMVV